MNKEKCPTCGTMCQIEWHGLDLVAESGDETLANKTYTPLPVSPQEAPIELFPEDYINVLQENLEAAKRHQDKRIRNLLIETYEDLIAIWEHKAAGLISHPEAPIEQGVEMEMEDEVINRFGNMMLIQLPKLNSMEVRLFLNLARQSFAITPKP